MQKTEIEKAERQKLKTESRNWESRNNPRNTRNVQPRENTKNAETAMRFMIYDLRFTIDKFKPQFNHGLTRMDTDIANPTRAD